jgi:uncharacterized membrane protein
MVGPFVVGSTGFAAGLISVSTVAAAIAAGAIVGWAGAVWTGFAAAAFFAAGAFAALVSLSFIGNSFPDRYVAVHNIRSIGEFQGIFVQCTIKVTIGRSLDPGWTSLPLRFT